MAPCRHQHLFVSLCRFPGINSSFPIVAVKSSLSGDNQAFEFKFFTIKQSKIT